MAVAWRTFVATLLTFAVSAARAQPAESPSAELPASARTAAAAADTKPSQVSPAVEPAAFEWDFSWNGWDGLHMELLRRTRMTDDLPLIRLDEIKLAGRLGGNLEVDGAGFNTNGDLPGFDNGVQLRRARIKLRGDAILGVPFRYNVNIGYVPNQFSVSSFYVAVPDIAYVGRLRFGQFQPAMGLQLVTSSWDIPLMEPAAPLQAIAPRTSPGVEIGQPYLAENATWTLGVYGSGSANSEYGSAVKNLETLIGRLTWLALDDSDRDRPERNRFLHLGLSGNLQNSGNGQIRMRSRPESYIAPYVIDTGTIQTDKAATLAAEAGWVDGSFSVQGEILRAFVNQTGAGALKFGGLYAMASWYFTGESRPYDRQSGAFAHVRPLREFGFGSDAGWGALEAVIRYSYTDLSDGDIHGGRLSLLMTGLNWYLQPHLTWMFNVGAGSVRGGAANGNMIIVQTRVGVDF
jgi:phosphate-selective porin OprO/OprP